MGSGDWLAELWANLQGLVAILGNLLYLLLVLALRYALLIAWVAWWLGAANWKKAWPVLAGGAWVPLVLLMVLASLVWSNVAPAPCDCLGIVTLPNGLWQFGAVSGLVGLALFCGWLQGYFGWTPADVDPEPPTAHTAHGAHDAHEAAH